MIVPPRNLRHRPIVVRVRDSSMIACARCIESKRYERNNFLFNLIFVIRCPCEHIERTVAKLAEYLHSCEVFESVLSDPQTDRLETALRLVHFELNHDGFCTVKLGKFKSCFSK
ncbi:hypothetical protein ACOME3_007403 [Neoechinorhynchus agilis]